MVKKCIFLFASVMALGVVSAHAQGIPTAGTPTTGIPRFCSAKAAAKVFADSLAIKIRNSLAAQATSGAITRPSVRVGFSGPRTRPVKTTIDFSDAVSVTIDPNALTNKVTVSGSPAPELLYKSCDAGSTLFTVFISYRTMVNGVSTPVAIRETFERTIPGQYL